MSEQLYKVFINSVKGIRKLVPYNDEFYNKTFQQLSTKRSEGYESIYIYNQKHFDEFQKTKSLSGIKDVKTDKVVFDFDSKEDVNKAFQDTKVLVNRLIADGFKQNELVVYFSGNKGLHVEVNLSGKVLSREEFETITQNYAGDLNTFDTSVSDEQRVFRLPMSFNEKGGKYKFPLSVADLLDPAATMENIMEYAKNPDIEEVKTVMSNVVEADATKFKIKKKEVKVVTSEVVSTDKPDMTRKRKELTEAKYVLEEGFFDDGERNEACMILASTYRYLGYNKELAYNMIKATLRLRAARLGYDDYDREEVWKTVIEKVYSPNWQGGVYSEDKGLLKKTIERYGLKKVEDRQYLVDLGAVADHYRDFAVNIDKNTIKLGIPEIDDKVRITTSSLVCLLAAAGAGKSSCSFSFMNHLSKNDCKSIFFSMDMSIPQVYQRLIQKHTGKDGDYITDSYKLGREKEIVEYNRILQEEYKNVRFCFKSGITTDVMRQMIIEERDRTGIIPKLVIADYLECIQGPFSDSNANKALIATQLKDIANEFGLCMFLLVQPQKNAGTPADELNSYRQIKGSSVLEEQASTVLTLSRPGFSPKHPEDDNYAVINVVKNRMGQLSSTDLHWEGMTGTIRSLMDEERQHLKALRDAINMQKAEEESGGGFKKFGSGRNNGNGDMY